jgi:hypothetical protein
LEKVIEQALPNIMFLCRPIHASTGSLLRLRSLQVDPELLLFFPNALVFRGGRILHEYNMDLRSRRYFAVDLNESHDPNFTIEVRHSHSRDTTLMMKFQRFHITCIGLRTGRFFLVSIVETSTSESFMRGRRQKAIHSYGTGTYIQALCQTIMERQTLPGCHAHQMGARFGGPLKLRSL